jgi:hypothetical protein
MLFARQPAPVDVSPILEGTIGLTAPPPEDMAISVARARLALARRVGRGSLHLQAARDALSRIEEALVAIDAIRAALDEAEDLTREALETAEEARRALLADRYDDLRSAINEASGAMDPESGQLTAHPRARLEVPLDWQGRTHLVVRGADLSSGATGLDLPPPLQAFSADAEIEAAAASIGQAHARLDRAASVFLDDAQALTAAAGMQKQTEG